MSSPRPRRAPRPYAEQIIDVLVPIGPMVDRARSHLVLRFFEGISTRTIATTPQLRQKAADRAHGVAPAAREVEVAAQVLAASVIADYAASNLGHQREWITIQAGRRGGNGGLTDTLVDLLPLPAGQDRRRLRADLLRAIQRAGPATKTGRKQSHQEIRKPDYLARMGMLALMEARISLHVLGDWTISRDEQLFVWKRTDKERGPSDAHTVIQHRGQGFTEAVVEALSDAVGRAVSLDMVYALKIEDSGYIAPFAQRA